MTKGNCNLDQTHGSGQLQYGSETQSKAAVRYIRHTNQGSCQIYQTHRSVQLLDTSDNRLEKTIWENVSNGKNMRVCM